MKKLVIVFAVFLVGIMALDLYFKKNKTLEIIATFASGEYAEKLRMYNYLSDIYKEYPSLNQDIKIIPIQKSTGKVYTYKYFGYSFQAPWLQDNRLTVASQMKGIRFKNGISLVVLNSAIQEEYMDVVIESLDFDAKQKLEIKKLFGTNKALGNFDFFHGMLAAKPTIKHLMKPKRDLMWLALLTSLKLSVIGETEKQISILTLDNQKAVQIGDPNKNRQVTLYGFPKNSDPVQLIVNLPENHPNFQNELGQLVSSIQ